MDEEINELPAELFQDTEDEGANENFFAWFFRGKGPKGVFSGAAFNRNRLSSEGSAYSTFFEDNYVQALLGETGNPIAVIAGLYHFLIMKPAGSYAFMPIIRFYEDPNKRNFHDYECFGPIRKLLYSCRKPGTRSECQESRPDYGT